MDTVSAKKRLRNSETRDAPSGRKTFLSSGPKEKKLTCEHSLHEIRGKDIKKKANTRRTKEREKKET